MELFVPGRLCLFGEHSDWAGAYRVDSPQISPGYCLVAGTDQGLYAAVSELEGRVEFETHSPDGTRRGPQSAEADCDALDEWAQSGDFFRYAAGVAAEVTARHRVSGLRVSVTRSDLPLQKGLSSSAAICVLVARAYNRLYGLGLDLRGEMDLAYAGERRSGSECGRMDQICAFGRRTSLLTFDGDGFEIESIAVPNPMHLLLVDLRRSKDTRRILSDLHDCYPDASSPVARAVRKALGPDNAALVAEARTALEAGNAPALGRLMTEAQTSFDRNVAPASPALTSPRLHEVLGSDAARALSFGGKGVGSQGDGCAQFVTRDSEQRGELARTLSREFDVACFPLTLGRTA